MSCFRHISISTESSTMLAYHHRCKKRTMKHQQTSNTSLPHKMQLSNMFCLIITRPMLQSEQSKVGKTIWFLVLSVSSKIYPLHYGVNSLNKPTSLSNKSIRFNQICIWSTPWLFPLSVNTYGTARNKVFGAHQKELVTIMGSTRRQLFLH